MSDLTPKQARFVEEYLLDLNATQGAIRAGYSAKTAEVQGSRLLGNVKVREVLRGRESRPHGEAVSGERLVRRKHELHSTGGHGLLCKEKTRQS